MNNTFDLTHYDVAWMKNLTVPLDIFYRHRVLPLHKIDGVLHIGIADLTDRSAIDTISFHIGYRVQPIKIAEDQLSPLLEQYFSPKAIHPHLEFNFMNNFSLEEESYLIQETTVNYDEPLIRFVNNLIEHAITHSASDIHIEPYESICRIRYRRDGVLYTTTEIPIQFAARLTARLKIMAKCDIAERRLPQDGRFQLHNRDVRVNSCPTLFGEKIVLRLLNINHSILTINELGLSAKQLTLFIEKISQPYGLILVTGPTGSGKTVTMYSALSHLNTSEKNISTVEDPIEIQLSGINQVNIHPKIGLQFDTVLRTLLRQDPDIIMVGEIRDKETAEIAIQAAQTGHLVFSTLHTNNAIGAITRLQAMGIPSYNIANSLSLIIAQRLVRKLCIHCKLSEIITTETLEILKIRTQQKSFYKATGCQQCLQGYHGRIGLYELLNISETINDLINHQATYQMYYEQAKKENFTSLIESGFEKISQGITSFGELQRVLQC